LGRYIESVCKMCRREGVKLFLKGTRCYTDKCAIERRPYPPGQHGQKTSKPTDYAIHMREKQKVKRIYGIMERQFEKYFEWASRMKGNTGDNLIVLLEMRLDNIVYRFGFARCIKEARQMVNHGHVLLNGKKVTIPSHLVKKNDVISVKEKSKNLVQIVDGVQNIDKKILPPWLELNIAELKGYVKDEPKRSDITMPVQEQLVVEFYSR